MNTGSLLAIDVSRHGLTALVALVCLIVLMTATQTGQAQSSSSRQADNDAYTITTTVRIAQPYDLHAMNDEFQKARLLKEEDGVGTFEITYRPLHEQKVEANPNWRQDAALIADYLRPRPAANWDEALRRQILEDLQHDGIDPDRLDDKTLVEKVSAWALKRSEFNT